MHGVINGLVRCQDERVEDLNKRIESRIYPSHNLQMSFSPRAVPTRYVRMPIVDCVKISSADSSASITVPVPITSVLFAVSKWNLEDDI